MLHKKHFKYTEQQEGINAIANQSNSELKYLRFSRLYLCQIHTIKLVNESCETIICIESGSAIIRVEEVIYNLSKYDMLYIPLNRTYSVYKVGEDELNALIFEAPAEHNYEPVFVKYDQLPVQFAGIGSSRREVRIAFDSKNKADRLILGFCIGSEGGWTGWPPHEHGENLEELYVYVDLPSPGCVLQLYYNSLEQINTCTIREGDAFAIPSDYHPIVSIPGFSMKNIWVMAAKEAITDRRLDLAKIQFEFR